jgi:hypothetical protein
MAQRSRAIIPQQNEAREPQCQQQSIRQEVDARRQSEANVYDESSREDEQSKEGGGK